MRAGLSVTRRVRTLVCLAVWMASIGAAIWLYRHGVGGADAVGLAEAREYRVAPEVLGRLVSLEVVEGQRVTPGQVVARFGTELIEREISVANARLRQVASEVRATGVSLDVSTLQAERSFESEIEAADIDIQGAHSDSATDQAELSRTREELVRQRDLVSRGLTKAERLSELETRRAALEQAVKSWPARIAAVEARREAASARLREWRRAHTQGQGGSRGRQLQPIEEKVREQRETIGMLKTHLRNTLLRASSDAYVTRVLARPGDVLRPGDPVVTLVEARPRQLVAYLEEGRGIMLATGAVIRARRRSVPGQSFEATVGVVAAHVSQLPARMWINPSIPAWGREAYIELPPDAALDPGEMLDITLLRKPSGTPGAPLAARR